MKHAPLLLLIAWLSVACASEMPEPADDAPDRQAARSEVAEPPSPVVDPQTAPDLIFCVAPVSERPTLTEEQGRRMVISPDGRWIALPCDGVSENEAFRTMPSQLEPSR